MWKMQDEFKKLHLIRTLSVCKIWNARHTVHEQIKNKSMFLTVFIKPIYCIEEKTIR